MLGSLPGFGAFSGPNQGPVGCLAATIALVLMGCLVGGFFALLYWAYRMVE